MVLGAGFWPRAFWVSLTNTSAIGRLTSTSSPRNSMQLQGLVGILPSLDTQMFQV